MLTKSNLLNEIDAEVHGLHREVLRHPFS